ncbi:hypothetical protein L9F63_010770, partial [Diploptera punctata]
YHKIDTQHAREKEENRSALIPKQYSFVLSKSCLLLRKTRQKRWEISKNATYISPEIQNEIIQICSNLVTEKIVSRVNKAAFIMSSLCRLKRRLTSICRDSRKISQSKVNVSVHVPETKKKRLTRLCETCFIERHDSVLTFVELFQPIVVSLEEIAEKPLKISSSASNFSAAIEKSDFIDKKILRKDAKNKFAELFASSKSLSEEIFHCDLTVPRSRQSKPFQNTVRCYITPSIKKVLATLPVTTCSVERSFSTMKRVKSVSRNKVIDKLAGEKKRRLLLRQNRNAVDYMLFSFFIIFFVHG